MPWLNMSSLRLGFRAAFFAALLAFSLCAGVPGTDAAKPDKADLTPVAAAKGRDAPGGRVLSLTQGMAEIVSVGGSVSDVMVANPSIVDVTAVQSDRLYIVGTNLGSTNVIALDGEGNIVGRLIVHVKIDDGPIQKLVHEMFPDEDVKINTLNQQVILTGTVSTPEVSERIASMVAAYIGEIIEQEGTIDEVITNLLQVRGKAQVMLRVRVMEVSRTLLREKSADTDVQDYGGLFGRRIGISPDLGAAAGTVATGATEVPLATVGILEDFGALGPIDTVLTALERNGLGKILAEPNLTAISGEQAGFLAGGEFPVPSGKDQDGNIIIQFRSFGVSLNFRPVVLSEKRISMQLDTEVSSLSRDSIVQLAGIDVPGLDVRRATTTVELGSGSTLMIAGLLQSQTVKNLSSLPGMAKNPIIGALMGSDNFRRDESEMVVLVTPYLVEPFADKRQAEEVPLPDKDRKRHDALSQAFADNIRRAYGKLNLDRVFEGSGEQFGYIVE